MICFSLTTKVPTTHGGPAAYRTGCRGFLCSYTKNDPAMVRFGERRGGVSNYPKTNRYESPCE